MANGIEKIEEVIDYIESNITAKIDCDYLAKKMNLSVYEFRRIFSFVVGCPMSEYIRKRRLSLAATEIMAGGKADISEICEKYGYSNQSAFTRAFCEQHGVSPGALWQGNTSIKIYTRPRFSVNMTGGDDVSLKVTKECAFFVDGFSGISDMSDTCCCENVWNAFYETESDKKLSSDKIYAVYSTESDSVRCTIGEKSNKGCLLEASKWACFTLDTVNDDTVNETYGKIIYEWLPSAGFVRNENIPTVEVYPFDMSKEGFEWEIRIPII